MKRSCKLIYGAKFVQNRAVTLHATRDLSRASLDQSESRIFAREDFWTADKLYSHVTDACNITWNQFAEINFHSTNF